MMERMERMRRGGRKKREREREEEEREETGKKRKIKGKKKRGQKRTRAVGEQDGDWLDGRLGRCLLVSHVSIQRRTHRMAFIYSIHTQKYRQKRLSC